MFLCFVRVALFSALLCAAGGCAVNWNDISTYQSGRGVEDLRGKIKVGMTLEEVLGVVGGMPARLDDGSWHSILRDGDLWFRVSRGMDGVSRVSFWMFEEIAPEGGVRRFSSLDAESASPLVDPDHLILRLDSEEDGRASHASYSYDIYSSYDMKVDYDVRGDVDMKGSFILIGGTYYLLKSDGASATDPMAPLWLATLDIREFSYFSRLARRGGDEAKVLDVKETEKPLVIPLPGGRVFKYPPPWSCEGTFDLKTGAFDFAFGNWRFDVSGKRFKRRFSGVMEPRAKARGLPNGFPLDGWGVFKIGRDGLVPLDRRPKNIGEVLELFKRSLEGDAGEGAAESAD